MPPITNRLLFIDALKALASQLIVLHHLAFYGPMSDHAQALAPTVISWLSQDARFAVQVFLVLGGFLAAQSLAPGGMMLAANPFGLLWKRYLKLVTPYIAAVLMAIALAAAARALMEHDSVPGRPTLSQVMAHVLLLQSLLGHDGLSAGVWYIAIDFQLFSLLVGLLWVTRRVARNEAGAATATVWLVAALALTSIYYFNRDGDWDSWGVYFFGSYALGIASCWTTAGKRSRLWWLLPIVLVVGAALLLDYRPRLVVALATALALVLARSGGFLENWPKSRLIAYLGQISYSVFLVHFPVCLLINGLFARYAAPEPWVHLGGMIIAWLASIAGGALFYRFVESAAQAGFRRRRPSGLVRQTP
ncbi:MAG: acyltransferase [Candidatus Accumulibacter sp.]|uniref:acyltransferase family protein n=1 Tax=Accumulibacter sp. TaxID=2053492 RepID=UPI001A508217|nr:acyltransferase [Accumulibacter sp.]MBL8396377.1 acyltransferase [Accumulibacter sp.]